jgi:hypothetical protein
MSATLQAKVPASQKKKFGQSERVVPHHTQKAQKWYPAHDVAKPKKVCGQKTLYTTNGQVFCCVQRRMSLFAALASQGKLGSHEYLHDTERPTPVVLLAKET